MGVCPLLSDNLLFLNSIGMMQGNNEGKHLRWRPTHIGTKQEWQDRLKNIRIGKKGAENHTEKVEETIMDIPFYDENMYIVYMKNDVEAKVMKLTYIYFLCFYMPIAMAFYLW